MFSSVYCSKTEKNRLYVIKDKQEKAINILKMDKLILACNERSKKITEICN